MGKVLGVILLLVIFSCKCKTDDNKIQLSSSDSEWFSGINGKTNNIIATSSNGLSDIYTPYYNSNEYIIFDTKSDKNKCDEIYYSGQRITGSLMSSLGRYNFNSYIENKGSSNTEFTIDFVNEAVPNNYIHMRASFNLLLNGKLTDFSSFPDTTSQSSGLIYIGNFSINNVLYKDVYTFTLDEKSMFDSNISKFYLSKKFGLVSFTTQNNVNWYLNYN
jgi:hypothetical protein